MKITKILLLTSVLLVTHLSFGEKIDKDKDIYDFAVPVIEGTTKDDKTEVKPEDKAEKKEDTKEDNKNEKSTPDKLGDDEGDAQTLIRDKLIQKYKLRLDSTLDKLLARMKNLDPEVQKEALLNLRKTISERRALVMERKDIDVLKRDIIVSILDHVIVRLDTLIKQSAISDLNHSRA